MWHKGCAWSSASGQVKRLTVIDLHNTEASEHVVVDGAVGQQAQTLMIIERAPSGISVETVRRM